MNTELISFPDTVKQMKDGTIRLTIPKKIAKFEGIEVGDSVKVWIKKVPKKSKKGV